MSKECPECGTKIQNNWQDCPKCSRLLKDSKTDNRLLDEDHDPVIKQEYNLEKDYEKFDSRGNKRELRVITQL